LTVTQHNFEQRLAALQAPEFAQSLTQLKRGVEREGLRIKGSGALSQAAHPRALGSALTHESITTDFSESLLEFITPPADTSETTVEQLNDIHKFVMSHIGDEMLWPMSMPCFVDDEDSIPIANFGSSNVGKMKQVYRIGLKNRYGSMMQAISGVHFNFSLPDSFWPLWAKLHNNTPGQDQINDDYLALIRNYRRTCWLIPFLFGASPALCSSFLKGKKHQLPFKKVGKGTFYLPYATSLRMSDLGYTNAEQSALQICYNKLDNYVRLLREAMQTPSTRFSRFAAGEDGHWQQLSNNILQIENELYSPIRPKQPTLPKEKPSDALVRRGISYIEVRALDINPFSAIGIDGEQMDFLDVYLMTCLLMPSEELTLSSIETARDNMNKVVLEGRNPDLMLDNEGVEVSMQQWGAELFDKFEQVAALLDKANKTAKYSDAVNAQRAKLNDPAQTPSGKIMQILLEDDADNSALGLLLAKEYAQSYQNLAYTHHNEADFIKMAEQSLQAQQEIEAADDKDFETYIRDYYNEPPAKKNA